MLYEVIVSSLLRSPIMGCECGQIHGMLRNLVCCRSVFHRLVHHGALGQEVGSNGESCTALASRTRCRGARYYVALQDMKTLKNQAKKRYSLLVTLLLEKYAFLPKTYIISKSPHRRRERLGTFHLWRSALESNMWKLFPKTHFHQI